MEGPRKVFITTVQQPVQVTVALEHIDGVRRRPTRGMRTAREAYAELPAAAARIDRQVLYEEAHCAIEAAVQDLKHPASESKAERARRGHGETSC